MKSALCIELLLAALLSLSSPQSSAPAGQSAASPTSPVEASFPNSEEGFRAQFNQITQAYCSGDTTGAALLIQKLAIPNAPEWFAANFDPKEAAPLSRGYPRLFSRYTESLEKTLGNACRIGSLIIVSSKTDRIKDESSALGGSQRAFVAPRKELAVTRFNFNLQGYGKNADGWTESFLYMDGAFRFVGIEDRPFWQWQDGSLIALPSEYGHYTSPPKAINAPQPPFPPGAKPKNTLVVLQISIDDKGKVIAIRIISGEASYVTSAVDTVKHWRFKPAKFGSLNVGCNIQVDVNFWVWS